MRKDLKIPLNDSKFLRVVADMVDGRSAVIIVHGLTSYVHQSLYEEGRRYFNAKNLDVYRPFLYSWEDDSRDLRDCTLAIHGSDLDELIKTLREKNYDRIFLIGHSYGCPSIMHMKEDFDCAVMWDGTCAKLEMFTEMQYLKEHDMYIDFAGSGYMMGASMFKEAVSLRATENWVGSLRAPSAFFYASKGILHPYMEYQRETLTNAGIKNHSEIIEGADHNFTDDSVKDKLFEKTYNYCNNQGNL